MRETRVLAVDAGQPAQEAIDEAARVLREGGLVAFPTETVYGLGANAFDPAAVRSVFSAKGRPATDPLIVHLASADDLPRAVRDFPDEARLLAETFWPGPLTMLLPRAERIAIDVTAGLDTVGVRVPDHEVARRLVGAAGVPVAAPSANRFGRTSPTTARHVLDDLAGDVDLVLDAGPTRVGVESTVLDMTADPPWVLRPGGVSVEDLERVLGRKVRVGGEVEVSRSPGQLLRHYAPRARLELFEGPADQAVAALVERAGVYARQGKRVGVLVAEEDVHQLDQAGSGLLVRAIGPSDELETIARNLFARLRDLDSAHPDVILARTFGTRGLGLAVSDRLRRAAEGRVTRVGED